MPRKRHGRTHLVAFAGVVVDHVEDHLDAGAMQLPHQRLEFGDLAARRGPSQYEDSGAKKPIEL